MPTPARVKQLVYEVQMLGYTRRKLQTREFDGQWTANTLIESFCLLPATSTSFFSKKADTKTF